VNISFNPAARLEFVETAGWYAEQAGERRAMDFRNEVQRSLHLLGEHPSMGTPSASNTRRIVVHRYPYSVIYRVEENRLRVLAIASHNRQPGYWRGRR